LFVCQRDYTKSTQDDFHKIRRKGGTWAAEKKLLDFGGNANHVTLETQLQLVRVGIRLGLWVTLVSQCHTYYIGLCYG